MNDDDVDSDEYRTADDSKLPRAKRVLSAGEAGQRLLDGVMPEDEAAEYRRLVRLDDDELWAERDAQVRRAKERELAEQRAEDRRQRARLLKGDPFNFPSKAIDAAISVWPRDTVAMGHVRKWITWPKYVGILAGGPGTGKSTAAAWVALEVGASMPLFVRAHELEARGRYDKDLRRDLRASSMLVIDDVGVEVLDSKSVFRGLLDEVIDMFYGDRKRIVITTNLQKQRKERADGTINIADPPQFAERYGARVVSRLAEVGEWLPCGDEDLRRGQLLL
jgi:DNA replication protein DnaC